MNALIPGALDTRDRRLGAVAFQSVRRALVAVKRIASEDFDMIPAVMPEATP